MYLLNYLLICLLLFIFSLGSPAKMDAAPTGRAVAIPEEKQAPKEMPEGHPPLQEQRITLAPFYCLQSNSSRVWMERILVTFTLAEPKKCLQHDLDNPTFRKLFYELLQSGEPEAIIQAQALDQVKRQVGIKVDPLVQISRSVLIVR